MRQSFDYSTTIHIKGGSGRQYAIVLPDRNLMTTYCLFDAAQVAVRKTALQRFVDSLIQAPLSRETSPKDRSIIRTSVYVMNSVY